MRRLCGAAANKERKQRKQGKEQNNRNERRMGFGGVCVFVLEEECWFTSHSN
jgi:hypothetical protein